MKKEKRTLTQCTVLKVAAFIAAVITLLSCATSVLGAMLCAEFEVYTKPKDELLEEQFHAIGGDVFRWAADHVSTGYSSYAYDYLEEYNVLGMSMRSTYHTWTYGDISGKGAIDCEYDWFCYTSDPPDTEYPSKPEYYSIHLYVDSTPKKNDEFFFAYTLINTAYALRYRLFAIGAASLLLFIACFIFLLISSGRRAGHSEPQSGWGTKIPFDVLTAIFALALFAEYTLLGEADRAMNELAFSITLITAITADIAALMGWFMSLALRVKLGILIKKTLIYMVISAILKAAKSVFTHVKGFILKLPLVWKTAVSFAGLLIFEGIVMLICFEEREYDMLVLFWVIESALLFFIVICTALILKRLKAAGAALASGDYSYRTDTTHMIGDFKEHAENLNNAAGGMVLAVNEKMKSERLKTELITNVSHDLKTPLTSIINYTDLICRSGCEDETVTGYAEVLHRQSEKLKRLIDDLVEASKASTGSLDIQLEQCKPGVMITQAAGEYANRLEEAGLTLVLRGADEDITVMADGRRLWRVFDNLMNNICKYAQCGTRVYLGLEKIENSAVISFKNTSREPLNLTAEEFMERFVQGDISRSSDGNGLGLSIAKSLTQLQKGEFDLTVDGDLFKV
ncbi:MAG: HAMP domain-containing histidine kinase, partial [Oscillospiraceae bacterium]|nr:HAMP domain-containing histidine kinase [Oscillospiraceae bacterium]